MAKDEELNGIEEQEIPDEETAESTLETDDLETDNKTHSSYKIPKI